MDTLALLFGVLLCLTVVNCRSFDDRRDTDPISESEDDGHKKHGAERHRRRRWQTNYGYEYPVPVPPYYPERRDYDRNQQDLLPKIVRLLEEISAYVKRPQPPPLPPQPIYIPYPVPYPVPQYAQFAPCTTTDTKKPNITTRFPEMEDTNQNWGFVPEEENSIVGDGVRPISFDPIKPIRPLKRPAPEVEHGTVQADSSHTTQAPKFEAEASESRVPIMCNAAILSCCAEDKAQRKQCFSNFGCGVSFDNGKACSNDAIQKALEEFKSTYAPV